MNWLTGVVPFLARDDRLLAFINLLAILGGIGVIYTIVRFAVRFINGWVRQGLKRAVIGVRLGVRRQARRCRRDVTLCITIVFAHMMRLIMPVSVLVILSISVGLRDEGLSEWITISNVNMLVINTAVFSVIILLEAVGSLMFISAMLNLERRTRARVN